MKGNNKVVIISYAFPPRPGVASVRMGGLAKYLPQHGWDPTFVTVELPDDPDESFRVIQTEDPGDVTGNLKKRLRLNPKEGLQKQLGVPDRISNAKKPIIGRITKKIEGFISYPDKRRPWLPVAMAVLRDLLSREEFGVLISTSPTPVTHLIARKISDEFGIPWVADFRDLWTGNHYYSYGPIRKFLDRSLEMRTISRASALVSVSEPLCRSLSAMHGSVPVYSIPNGFDPDQIGENDMSDEFTITYTGYLYLGKRDPELLFKVVRDLLAEGKLQQNLRIKFYGEKFFWVEELINKYELKDCVFQYGVVDRVEALGEQRSSQILLSLNWDNPLEEGVYTGKIFDYLAAKRPILALGGPPGVVSELLERTKAGSHIRTEGELRKAILAWYAEYQENGFVSYQGNDKIHDFSHVKMAERFSQVLNEVSK